MPEFQINGANDPAFRALDYFTRGYVTAMFWTNEEPGTSRDPEDDHTRKWDPETGSSLPGDISFAELAPATLARIVADCKAFQETNAKLLERAYDLSADGKAYDSERAGHDFLLTRDGHGAGFWSREFETDDGTRDNTIGDELTAACKAQFSPFEIYLGDDGKIYA